MKILISVSHSSSLYVIGRGPEATSKLFTPESEVDILVNLIVRTLRLISQK